MTNGDVIKDLFNPYKICEYKYSVHVYLTEEDFWKADYLINCHTSWWNAPYQPKEKESATVAATSKQQESCTEIKTMTKEQDYMRGYKDGKSDVLDEVRAELIQSIQNGTLKIENGNEELFRIIEKYKAESKESATVAKFHDFYLEDQETWPPEDKEILVKNCVGDNFLAYLIFDDGEEGGWGFYSEDGDLIAGLDEIDAWMPIPQHERDKNYIPKRRTKDLTIDAPGSEEEEEKDR